MIKPKVIHPREILLYKRVETETDPEFGPTGKISWSEPVLLQGQVKYVNYEKLHAVGDGSDPACDGHIVFYDKDWVEAGGQIGDELEIAEDFISPSRLIVVEMRPAAHYKGRNWHIHVYFSRKRTHHERTYRRLE